MIDFFNGKADIYLEFVTVLSGFWTNLRNAEVFTGLYVTNKGNY